MYGGIEVWQQSAIHPYIKPSIHLIRRMEVWQQSAIHPYIKPSIHLSYHLIIFRVISSSVFSSFNIMPDKSKSLIFFIIYYSVLIKLSNLNKFFNSFAVFLSSSFVFLNSSTAFFKSFFVSFTVSLICFLVS